MIVECPRCESEVDARVLGTHDLEDEDATTWRVSLAACPLCGQPLLGSQEMVQNDEAQWEWTAAETLWPIPPRRPHQDIPDAVRECLEEGQRCWKAKAFSACAVMVGRALEAVCVEHVGERTLARGLRALRDQGILDGRLYEWSESLRAARTLDVGPHAMGRRTTAQDARDLLDFALAACEYVYVFSRAYGQYLSRRGAPAELASKAQTEPISAAPEPEAALPPPAREESPEPPAESVLGAS
jgi:hypothetical protein